jgi:hypothetical protein
MMALLLPRVWLAIVLVMSLVGTNFVIYRSGKASVRAEWNIEKLAATKAMVLASEAARAKEQVLQTKVTKVEDDYQAEKRRRVADAAVNADRLRDLQSALADNSSNTASTSGTDDPRDAIINQCASSLVILDRDFKSLAAQTSSLQSYASNVCVSQ